MAAMTTTANKIHGHTGVEDAAGAGEVVAVGTGVTELAELVWGAGVAVVVAIVVVVVVVVDVDVDVEVEVFVAVLVEVFVGALVVEDVDVDVEVRVGASVVGGLVVRVGIGVRDGSVGRLSERDALGRFEPPPHDAIRTSAIARSAVEGGLVLPASLLHLLELRDRLVNARIDLSSSSRARHLSRVSGRGTLRQQTRQRRTCEGQTPFVARCSAWGACTQHL